MKRAAILSWILFLCEVSAIAQTKTYFQQKVDFNISVKLNATEKTLDGFEEIHYVNNAPDTLTFIWFHLWPNAYKNDRTAFSEQLLQNGRTDFYFSSDERRGYINRLDFKVDGVPVKIKDSSAIDIIKIYLNAPLLPGMSVNISTPFHEKIPFNFSRGGYAGKTFQITQWYPKPALYDSRGWHPMSYLDQGEFFNDFGTYNVAITVPQEYIVAATGVLMDSNEITYLKNISGRDSKVAVAKMPGSKKIPLKSIINKNSNQKEFPLHVAKTLHYHQDNVQDFAWFANPGYLVQQDTMKLNSGRIINVYAFYNSAGKNTWKKSIQYMKHTIMARSNWLGEYPYDAVTAIEASIGFTGGMEYPTITSISPVSSPRLLETLIEHELGHNWNYGILGSDERGHPWMDEGINSYYDRRYIREVSPEPAESTTRADFINEKFPRDFDDFFYRIAIESKKDQPIETPSEKFSELNYNLIAYHKTALWLEFIEKKIGRQKMDDLMHTYYQQWKFRHPTPEDFKNILKEPKWTNADSAFELIHNRGPLFKSKKRIYKISSLFNFRNTGQFNYNFISPAVGYNEYDGGMAGVLFHNFTLPANKFQYLVAPLLGIKSKALNGISRLQYHWNSYGKIQQVLIHVSGEKFSAGTFTDSVNNKSYLSFFKLSPSVRIVFKEKNPRSTTTKFLQWKTYLLREKNVMFSRDTVLQKDIITYPFVNAYINQLKLVIDNYRALYPYRVEIQGEQGAGFAKLTLVGKYLFNYPSGGGLNVRVFGGKFLYLGDKTIRKQFETDRYHINLTGANGYEDYTYSNYFVGRNDFQKLPSQQIMIRDGGFKVRSDLLSSKIGKTDDWLAAINLQADIPKNIDPLQILPVNMPLKVFLDLGTYAGAFKTDVPGGTILYDAGLQISLIRNLVNIYIPVAYSKVYSDYYKSTITQNRFFKTISFSLDLQNLNLRKFNPQILL